MLYDHLIARVAILSGRPKVTVREVLSKLPTALMEIPEGDMVRTPLGVFQMVRKNRRKVNLPGSKKKRALLRERLQVRLGVSARLKKKVSLKKPVT